MKKTFKLTNPKVKYPRQIDAVKNEVRKYIKRERKKKLPEGVDFWDFDCKYGERSENSQVIHISEINKCIDGAETQSLESFYIEILVKPGHRTKRPKPEASSDS